VPTATDEDTDLAVAWAAAVREALEDSADRHGADVEALIDHSTTEGFAFLSTLDPIANSDPDDPAFAMAVQQAAEAYVAANPGMRVTESVETVEGRVLEAKGVDSNGGRVFRVQILKYGTSRNGNHYTEAVMRAAAPLYDGAKAYDHHRSAAELQSSTLTGLVGSYRNVEATADGLYGDLHLLPSAKHTAEALDATIVNQAAGLPSLVGISHDVMANFKPGRPQGGRRTREAVAITAVQSADVVADPSAGGQAVRVVQGGIETTPTGAEQVQESAVQATDQLAAVLQTLSPAQLAAAGLSRTGTPTTESTIPTERVVEGRVTEGGLLKTSFMGKTMIRSKLEDAGLPTSVTESFTAGLPEVVTEAHIDDAIASLKAAAAIMERGQLAPSSTAVVTQEALDKKVAAVDAMINGDYRKGYHSFKAAYVDFTGKSPRLFDEDFNRVILRESFGGQFDSSRRVTESLTSSSWDVILGDSITRRMVAEYNQPSLSTWRQIVSSVVPVNDFRTQRIDRLGGYGVLPAVNQGQPYQPLTSPGDEEATYSITKRGGTEDLTLEMVANDDLRSIQRIPVKLGLAASQTLYRFVWDILPTNAAIYDSVALFHATHSNTTSGALSQSALSAIRIKMRQQAAYGDTSDVLSIIPRILVVPSNLEEIAFQLVKSAVAIPATPAGPSDTPNLHSGMDLIVIDYYSDTNDFYVIADPAMCPTIEMGFYQGREEPELFTQSDQTVGSMFDADKITWKIRHIYSGTVLDYRGFQRGAN